METHFKHINVNQKNVSKPNDLKDRPIVAGPNSPTKVLSYLIEKLLKYIVPCLTTFIKNDSDFIKQLPGTLTFSCDKKAYTHRYP